MKHGAVERQIHELRGGQDAMQLKTFTKWWNSYLRERDCEVDDLIVDIQDGVELVNLIEVISGEYLGKYNKKPKHKMHKLENCKAGLEFLTKKKIKLLGIGPEDIVTGNKKLILALSWILILRYEVQKYGADTSELLKWARDRTLGYPGVEVRNFKDSFNDGLAFCALIHKHYPDRLNFDALNRDDDMENLKLAFKVADEEFGVPQLLDAEDLVKGKPDEKSVITYVAKLRQAFSDKTAALEEAARLAALARKKAEEEEHKRVTDEMVVDYNARAQDLNQWIKAADDDFLDKIAREDYGETPEESQDRLDHLNNNFRGTEKPPRKEEKAALVQNYKEIEARRNKEKRDAFEHPFTPSETETNWTQMDKDELEYEKGLKQRKKALEDALALAALEKEKRDKAYEALDHLLPAFRDRRDHEEETDRIKAEYDARVSDLAEWIKAKKEGFDEQLAAENFGNTPEETRGKLADLVVGHRKQEKPPKYEELLALDRLFQTVEARRQAERRPPFTYKVDSDELVRQFKNMEEVEQQVHDALLERLRRIEELLPVLARFRRMAARLNLWAECTNATCATDFSGKTVEELNVLLKRAQLLTVELRGQEATKRNLKANGAILSKEEEFHQEVVDTLESIAGTYASLQQGITNYQKKLRDEIERLKKLEIAQAEFDKLVLGLAALIEQAQDVVEVPLESDTPSQMALLVDQGNKLQAKLEQPTSDGVDTAQGTEKGALWNELASKLAEREAALKGKASLTAGAIDQKQRQYQLAVKHFDDVYGRHMSKVVMNRSNDQLSVKEIERVLKSCESAVADCEGRAETARGVYNEMTELVPHGDDAVLHSCIVTPETIDLKVAHLSSLLENLRAVNASAPEDVDAKGVQHALVALADKQTGEVDKDEMRERIGRDNVDTLSVTLPTLDRDTVQTFDPFPHANVGARKSHVNRAAAPASRDFSSVAPSLSRSRSNSQASNRSRSNSQASNRSISRTGSLNSNRSISRTDAVAKDSVPEDVAEDIKSMVTKAAKNLVPNDTNNDNLPVGMSGTAPSADIPDGKGGFTTGVQQKREIEQGINLYTTQSTSSPVRIMFDVEVHKEATIDFELSLEGSSNIEVVEPSIKPDLTTGRRVMPFTTARVGIITQIDPYQGTELKMKYSTRHCND